MIRQANDLNQRVAAAVAFYWRSRQQQADKQAEASRTDQGSRGSATGGYQMNGFSELITELLVAAGVDRQHIFYKKALELPGFFRPTKSGTSSSCATASSSPLSSSSPHRYQVRLS